MSQPTTPLGPPTQPGPEPQPQPLSPPVHPTPRPKQFGIKILDKKYFGSAGCGVTYRTKPKYGGHRD
jgi:hypothetical protein